MLFDFAQVALALARDSNYAQTVCLQDVTKKKSHRKSILYLLHLRHSCIWLSMPALRPSHHGRVQAILPWPLRIHPRQVNLNSLSISLRRRYAVEARPDTADAAQSSGSLLCMNYHKYIDLHIAYVDWQCNLPHVTMILAFNN